MTVVDYMDWLREATVACCPHCGGETQQTSSHALVAQALAENNVRCYLSARASYCGAPARGEYGSGGIAGQFFLSGRRNKGTEPPK